MLQPIRYLLDRPLCFRPERKLAGSDLHRRINCALQGTPNNRAERALRPGVIARKVSHCSKNPAGATAYAAFKTIIETARKRGKSLVSGLAEAFRCDNKSSDPTPSDSVSCLT